MNDAGEDEAPTGVGRGASEDDLAATMASMASREDEPDMVVVAEASESVLWTGVMKAKEGR